MTAGAKLTAALPQLFTTDLAASCAFFVEKLGFQVAFSYGDPPFYAQVFRDGARLNLRHVDTPLADAGRIRAEDLLAATITVDTDAAIEQLFREIEAAGAPLHQRLERQPWGARDFIVLDPDGNLLHFAGPAA